MDSRLSDVGVDSRDSPLFLLAGGVLPRRQHHTELEAPGMPLAWCSLIPSGLEVMAASLEWSMAPDHGGLIDDHDALV